MMRSMLLLASLVFAACSPLLAEQPANQWMQLSDGAFKLPATGWPDLTGSRFMWIADRDCGLVTPLLTEHPVDYGVWTISRAEPAWKFTPATLPEGGFRPDLWESQFGNVYLPGIRKILVVRQQWGYSRQKTPSSGWLVDPATAAWQSIDGEVWMCDKSKDYNPSAGRDGLRLPIWCGSAYDPINKEAVICGGGGTWGRVGKEPEKIEPGQWFYDESAKRTRRLLPDEKPLTARRWFPANCGTWTFAEADKSWKPIEQPLGQQPSGRLLPSMAFDADSGKIVLFGGDDLTRCLGDTWLYDCKSRTWSKAEPKLSPRARAAAAFVYVPDQKVVLLIGGYAGGWQALGDVWAYSVAKNEWTQLAIDLPKPAFYASGDFDGKAGLVTIAAYGSARGNKAIPILTLKLDLASAVAAKSQPTDPNLDYHCKGRGGSPLPGEWLAGKLAPTTAPDEMRKLLAALPANTWVARKPPYSPPARNWGSCIYDTRTHRGYVWGGGHSTYPGADVIEYDLLTDRWQGMAEPPNYNPAWLHGMVGGPPGVSFQGQGLLPTHSRKSYGIDIASNSLVTYVGDVYDLKHRLFVSNTGICPGKYGVATQVSFCPTPHGLYGYSTGLLVRANVAEGKWDEIAKGGPAHEEHNHLCYDSKRDRLIYFTARVKEGVPPVWVFDFKDKAWTQEKVEGKSPAAALGDSTFIPELDAAMLVFASDKAGPEVNYFYKPAEHKWYSAPYVGDRIAGINTSGRDYSPIWDGELKLVVRLQCVAGTQAMVMRIDPTTLKLTPLE